MAQYVAVLRGEENYCEMHFPDLPGSLGGFDSAEEAREFAKEVLLSALQQVIMIGGAIHEPTPIDAIRSNPANEDALDIFLVSVPDEEIDNEILRAQSPTPSSVCKIEKVKAASDDLATTATSGRFRGELPD